MVLTWSQTLVMWQCNTGSDPPDREEWAKATERQKSGVYNAVANQIPQQSIELHTAGVFDYTHYYGK